MIAQQDQQARPERLPEPLLAHAGPQAQFAPGPQRPRDALRPLRVVADGAPWIGGDLVDDPQALALGHGVQERLRAPRHGLEVLGRHPVRGQRFASEPEYVAAVGQEQGVAFDLPGRQVRGE